MDITYSDLIQTGIFLVTLIAYVTSYLREEISRHYSQ